MRVIVARIVPDERDAFDKAVEKFIREYKENKQPCAQLSNYQSVLNTNKRLSESLLRLWDEVQEYRDAAATYGIDAHTMCELAKSQIKTTADNCTLRHEIEDLQEQLQRKDYEIEELREKYERREKEPCDRCGLVYEVSRDTYEIPKDVDCIVDHNFCPRCGRYVKDDHKDKQTKKDEPIEPSDEVEKLMRLLGIREC